MKRSRLSPQATRDLSEIYSHIALDDERAAEKLINRFFDSFQQLVKFPELGTLRDDLHPGLRIRHQGRYLILFLAPRDEVEIAHVIHGAREIESLLKKRKR